MRPLRLPRFRGGGGDVFMLGSFLCFISGERDCRKTLSISAPTPQDGNRPLCFSRGVRILLATEICFNLLRQPSRLEVQQLHRFHHRAGDRLRPEPGRVQALPQTWHIDETCARRAVGDEPLPDRGKRCNEGFDQGRCPSRVGLAPVPADGGRQHRAQSVAKQPAAPASAPELFGRQPQGELQEPAVQQWIPILDAPPKRPDRGTRQRAAANDRSATNAASARVRGTTRIRPRPNRTAAPARPAPRRGAGRWLRSCGRARRATSRRAAIRPGRPWRPAPRGTPAIPLGHRRHRPGRIPARAPAAGGCRDPAAT